MELLNSLVDNSRMFEDAEEVFDSMSNYNSLNNGPRQQQPNVNQEEELKAQNSENLI